jgi:hypothetical protein
MICTGIVLHLIHELEQIVTIDIPPPLHRLLQHVHLTELKNGGSVADTNTTSQCCGSGSGIRNRFFPEHLFRIPDPKPIFLRAYWQFFLVKSSIILWKLAQIIFLKNKIIIYNFVRFVATKNSMTTNFFQPSLLLVFLDPGSEILNPGWVKVRIRDKNPGSATLLPVLEIQMRHILYGKQGYLVRSLIRLSN